MKMRAAMTAERTDERKRAMSALISAGATYILDGVIEESAVRCRRALRACAEDVSGIWKWLDNY